MVKAKALLTYRSTLTKVAKKGIEISPSLLEAVKESIQSGKNAVVREDGEFIIILPKHPIVEGGENHNEFESVYVMLITGFQSYGIPAGSLT